MFNMISFIVAKDRDGINILMSVLVNKETLEVENIKIAGDTISKEEFTSPIIVDKTLYEEMKNNELMDLSSKFVGKSSQEILEIVKNTLQEVK